MSFCETRRMLISALIPGRDWPGRDVGSLALVRDYHATYTRAPFFLPDREKEPFSAVWKEPFRLPNARNQGWIYTCHVSSFERPHSESLMKRLMKREKRKRSDKAFARFTLRRTTEVVEKNFSNRRAATVPRINIDRRLILFKTVSIKSLVRIFFPDPRKRKATLCSKSENHAWKGRERERERVQAGRARVK